MNEKELLELLEKVSQNKLSVNKAITKLKNGPFNNETTEHIALDYHRSIRQSLAEVVFAEPKTVKQVLQIADKLKKNNSPILFTRLTEAQEKSLVKKFPKGRLNKTGRTFMLNAPRKHKVKPDKPYVALFSAGTSDAPVIEEACDVCLAMNVPFEMHNDVGVAGLHRLLRYTELIRNASAVIVVAGMEGALPSVIGGIADAPVFAVPTSIGYGTSFNGISALLGMLNSCASAVTVSNIDNGFSAAYSACLVVKKIIKYSENNSVFGS